MSLGGKVDAEAKKRKDHRRGTMPHTTSADVQKENVQAGGEGRGL